MSYADKLRELRQARGWSMAELSARCGMHFTTVYAYERGKVNPRFNNAMRLAKALGVSLAEFDVCRVE